MNNLYLEFGEKHGRCERCNAETVLVTADQWQTHPHDGVDGGFVGPHGEVSGHWCANCNRLTALFLNGIAAQRSK